MLVCWKGAGTVRSEYVKVGAETVKKLASLVKSVTVSVGDIISALG